MATVTLPDPMPFLPPTKILNQIYINVGGLAVLLWDIILHLPQDYKMVAKLRINFFFVIYCIARVTSLVYVFGIVIITTTTDNCDYIRQVRILYPFTIPLSILPFVVRTFVLYEYNKYVVAFISMTWLSVLGNSIVVPTAADSTGVKATIGYCLDSIDSKEGNVRTLLCLCIHDTLIFVFTAWGLMRNSYPDVGLKNRIGNMVLGRRLLPFSKGILHNGQAYYLVILIMTFYFLKLSFKPMTLPCPLIVILISNMSSYVYRNMRLGDYTSQIDAPQHSAQRSGIAFQNSRENEGGDLELGDIGQVERNVGEHEEDITTSRNSN